MGISLESGRLCFRRTFEDSTSLEDDGRRSFIADSGASSEIVLAFAFWWHHFSSRSSLLISGSTEIAIVSSGQAWWKSFERVKPSGSLTHGGLDVHCQFFRIDRLREKRASTKCECLFFEFGGRISCNKDHRRLNTHVVHSLEHLDS